MAAAERLWAVVAAVASLRVKGRRRSNQQYCPRSLLPLAFDDPRWSFACTPRLVGKNDNGDDNGVSSAVPSSQSERLSSRILGSCYKRCQFSSICRFSSCPSHRDWLEL